MSFSPIPFEKPWQKLRNELRSRFNPNYLAYQIFEEPKLFKSQIDSSVCSKAAIKFSIILPTYGIASHYVTEAAETIFTQKYKNWEMCIWNDGDSDPKLNKALVRLKKREPEKVLIGESNKNNGICAATRSAIGMAKGDYLVFLDADDRLHKKALATFASRIHQNPGCDFLYSNHDIMTDWGLRKFPVFKPGWSPELLLHVNYINHLKVVRREVMNGIPNLFSNESNGSQDWDLCLKLLSATGQVCHIPLFLYHWRARSGSIASGDPSAKPYALTAQKWVRREFVKTQSPKLDFDFSKNHLAFRRPLSPNRFRSVRIGTKAELEPDIVVCNETSNRDLLVLLRSQLSEQINARVNYVILSDGNLAALDGSIESLLAYTELPGVGAAWPFRKNGTRCSFTLGPKYGELIPLERIRSHFSSYAGNILTGPLHGLATKCETLSRVVDSLLKSGDSDWLDIKFDSNVIGAMIGLENLRHKLRNISVNSAFCEPEMKPVTVPHQWAPWVDPYI